MRLYNLAQVFFRENKDTILQKSYSSQNLTGAR